MKDNRLSNGRLHKCLFFVGDKRGTIHQSQYPGLHYLQKFYEDQRCINQNFYYLHAKLA